MKKQFIIEDANICARNFAGARDRFGNEGRRTFLLRLKEEQAQELIDDGWDVREFNNRDDDDLYPYFIQVNVKFNGYRDPNIYLQTRKNRTRLEEGEVGQLDYAEFEKIDISIVPFISKNSKTGRAKAYLRTFMGKVIEDELINKWEDIFDVDDDENDDEAPF